MFPQHGDSLPCLLACGARALYRTEVETANNPISLDADDFSDDDRLEEPASRNKHVGGVPESPDQESSPGASRDNALSPARRTVRSRSVMQKQVSQLKGTKATGESVQ
ncbi:hypothetical protein NDU88_006378 [Pleurodeles waltl]|uniref:Uncharacterized protein n=1 Tax=Pleurodeles waltl TaxID=8319 RepID=A0AAV7X1D2_PLEWA|nr:hypothetical protein NDU88_006378 [Pleurodeles waltl]